MSENTLKIGDVVRIKSGGPDMTITHNNTGSDKNVVATWYDVNLSKFVNEHFKSETLDIVTNK